MSRYLDVLREDPDEVGALADDLLITVTSFFRDPEVHEHVSAHVFPDIFSHKGGHDDVRVWSVGCATGEEAYTLAILLLEEAAKHDAPPRFQVFASDLHEHSLTRAREGFYPGDIETDVSPERLKRWFDKSEGGYRVRKEVRELVVFTPHNLLSDPPFSKLDMISCRNLLIYLQREVQQEVSEIFHYALRTHGYLLLGASESIESSDLFRVEDKRRCVYRKRNVPAPEPRLPVFPSARRRLPGFYDDPERYEPAAYGALHQRMVERYGPPSILVSPDDKVVHLSEHAGRYLVHPGGELTSSVFKLVREELRIELRGALHSAREKNEPVRSRSVEVGFDGSTRSISVDVRPAPSRDEQGFALVLFDEREPPVPVVSTATAQLSSAQLESLQGEIDEARQRLQGVIEEYETSQEEMKASNEELQSANEELRSTMEELETSKEELQSMNEELQTVNQENRHKVEELDQLSADLQNLLAATDIATLFLDCDLRIMRFTPLVGAIFNVRPTDRGRPISDITNRLGYQELESDAQEVLRTLVSRHREVEDESGRWYMARVLPYRSLGDRIEGVVITFVDITSRVDAEQEVRRNERRLRALVDATSDVIFRMSPDWQEMRELDGRGFIADTQEPRRAWLDTYIVPEDQPRVLDRIREAIRDKATFELEHRVRRIDGSVGWTLSRAVPLVDDRGEVFEWFGAASNVTARREAEESLRQLAEELEQRVTARTREVRALAASLTMAEERERSRLARVLHDDVQQLLYGIEMKIEMARKDVTDVTPSIGEELGKAREWIRRAIELTRRLTVDLSPPVLDQEGVVEALRWLSVQMQELYGLTVSIEVADGFTLRDRELAVLLFKCVRELLFNVAKHAETNRAIIRIGLHEEIAYAEVADEGTGFEPGARPADGAAPSGLGLTRMGQRLALMGGSVSIESRPGGGTRVAVRVPVEAARGEGAA